VTGFDEDSWDQVILATGAQPYVPPIPTVAGLSVMNAWDAIVRPDADYGDVLVVDWGGDWIGLDAAELLRKTGHRVTLACAALHPGELLHQYQRALYLARIDALKIPILHHVELAEVAGHLALRNVFSGRVLGLPACDTIVAALGRVPADALWPELEGTPNAVRVGDVLGPRSLDEATLEGALAAYRGAVDRPPSDTRFEPEPPRGTFSGRSSPRVASQSDNPPDAKRGDSRRPRLEPET
jgi:NADPH-dependent 2,4-dienoyl-CoA reductase/sulfur reductase-like enzyme